MNFKFYTSVAKGSKLKVRKFWGLVHTFVEVTGEKLVWGPFCPHPPSWIGLMPLSSKRRPIYLIRSSFLNVHSLVKSSCLPVNSLRMTTCLNSFSITEKDILAIINSISPSKSNGWYNISIKMRWESLTKLLKMIFKEILNDVSRWFKGT